MSGDTLLWAGLDLGTQSAKATIVSDDGATLAAAGSHPLRGTRDGDRHEQDPQTWVQAAAEALGAALTGLRPGDRDRVAGIAVCSTSGTIAVLDPDSSPTIAGLMYDDARGAAFAPSLQHTSGDWDGLGITIQPSWAICRIAWLASRGMLPPGCRVAHQGDIIAEAMTGARAATDWTSALKSGYDANAEQWLPAIYGRAQHIHAAGRKSTMSCSIEQLPLVVAPGTLLGHTNRAWQEASGLRAGTPVFAGMTDGCAAQLGAGSLRLGDWHTVLGTTLVLKGVSDRPVSIASGSLYSHRAPHSALWMPGGASNTGAGILADIAPDADLAALDASLRRAPARQALEKIVPCYPLARAGERFPFLDPTARGFALCPDERPLQELRRLPEPLAVTSLWAGVACVERLCYDILAEQGIAITGQLSSSGGGTRSGFWTMMRASLLGRPIRVPESAQGSLGMAILARWGAGQAGLAAAADLPDIASAMSHARALIQPNDDLAAPMADAYVAFRSAVESHGWLAARDG